MTESPADAAVRLAAVEYAKRVSPDGVITSEDLRAGFFVDGIRTPLINPQRGIFKPAAMQHLLSVRTVYPRTGARVWYDDQRAVHDQVERGDQLVDYAFMGTNANARDNQWLRDAGIAEIPFLYFLGVAPQRYSVVWPTFVAEWSAENLKVRLAFGANPNAGLKLVVPDAPERRYGLQLVRQRLHQARFREAVMTAYGSRCAISGLPEPRLLDAAHIVADKDEEFGQPVVPNGIPLSKLHHAAFDANLIGIDRDYRIHISDALLSMNDGPMFEHGLKAMAGQLIKFPSRDKDYPDRGRLANRFESFRKSRV